ncbi:hypothetical protein [Luteimonas huabeiensis]|uniref:hypothetical protein n=1 Tax=Luteimonas huabeiensis TaxID=1244513 RepID=UPI00046658A1|nr:hypothetical protein [Luteimonas huabeiensis]
MLAFLAILPMMDISAQSGFYERLRYRDDDPFVFCTQGQDPQIEPFPCWRPQPPYTGAYTLMPYCRPPNPYGWKSWTYADRDSLQQYLRVCPKAGASGQWEGAGRPEFDPVRH